MLEPAQKILLVYGVISLSYGFVLGVPLSMVRMKRPTASRHLVTAHLAAIIQGAVHLGLSLAVDFGTLGQTIESAASWLLVAGSALFVLGSTTNWLQNVGDHFAERSLGWRMLALSAPLNVTGLAVILTGVLRAV